MNAKSQLNALVHKSLFDLVNVTQILNDIQERIERYLYSFHLVLAFCRSQAVWYWSFGRELIEPKTVYFVRRFHRHINVYQRQTAKTYPVSVKFLHFHLKSVLVWINWVVPMCVHRHDMHEVKKIRSLPTKIFFKRT